MIPQEVEEYTGNPAERRACRCSTSKTCIGTVPELNQNGVAKMVQESGINGIPWYPAGRFDLRARGRGSVSRADTRLFQRGNWVLNYSARRILRGILEGAAPILGKKALESGFRVSPGAFCLLLLFPLLYLRREPPRSLSDPRNRYQPFSKILSPRLCFRSRSRIPRISHRSLIRITRNKTRREQARYRSHGEIKFIR